MLEETSKNQLENGNHKSYQEKDNLQDESIEQNDINEDKLENYNKDELIEIIEERKYHFSGPLPHPSILKEYEEIMPGAMDRIIKMAEDEQKHRQSIEIRCIETESRDSKMGIIGAILISIILLIVGGFVMILAKSWVTTAFGFILSGGGIATIIANFIKGTTNSWKIQQSEQDEEK